MKQHREGLLLVISGPAGVGKGTINAALLERNSDMRMSVSATTRAPRPGEIEGLHYFFKTEEAFLRMIEDGEFLEYTRVFNMNYYGTPKSFVLDELAAGRSVILEIDVEGGMNVKRAYPDAVLIFIAPPSMNELQERLIGRNTETPEQIERRFKTAFSELERAKGYDYVVINEVIDVAVSRVERIISAERCRTARNRKFLDDLTGGMN
ncbi:MAG: guanylate kinase [Clostridia bacterium]|nr:guanylate kinase [Clostridia bacterium]